MTNISLIYRTWYSTVNIFQIGAKTSCNLIVNILDKNDNAPQLLTDEYEGHIMEDAPVGSLVQANGSNPLVIHAFDADAHSNALVRFKILEPIAEKMFFIDGFTGKYNNISLLIYLNYLVFTDVVLKNMIYHSNFLMLRIMYMT